MMLLFPFSLFVSLNNEICWVVSKNMFLICTFGMYTPLQILYLQFLFLVFCSRHMLYSLHSLFFYCVTSFYPPCWWICLQKPEISLTHTCIWCWPFVFVFVHGYCATLVLISWHCSFCKLAYTFALVNFLFLTCKSRFASFTNQLRFLLFLF